MMATLNIEIRGYSIVFLILSQVAYDCLSGWQVHLLVLIISRQPLLVHHICFELCKELESDPQKETYSSPMSWIYVNALNLD